MTQGHETGAIVPDTGASGLPTPILIAEDLRKSYGSGEALRGLSFSLQAGHVLGFLGPNGAGKTTTIRILTTVLEPTSGRFTIDNITSEDPTRIRHVIGVLPEGLGFPKGITALEYLMYFGQLYGRSVEEAREVSERLLKDVGMQNRADSAIGTFSHGMQQRLGIARALINDPKVVFLDEPTLGLDPRGQQELLSLIRRISRERNAGVILSSHLLSEIEGICDDVVIMNAGQVVAQGTVAEVSGQTKQGPDQLKSVRVRIPLISLERTQLVLEALSEVKSVTTSDTAAGWLSVEFSGSNDDVSEESFSSNSLLEVLISEDIPILGFEVVGGRLQDVFLELTAEVIQ